jgi:YVTN family beta-propeller protein
MNDFERRLSDALKSASESYRPSDPHAAKERFLHRLRRRRLVFYSAGVAVAGAAAALALVLIPDRITPPPPEPLPPAAAVEQQTTIEVGERPSGVAFGDDAVWVANSGDGTVMVVDPATRQVEETIEVGGDPDDVAVGVGAGWVSDSGAGTITRVSLPSAGDSEEAPATFQVGDAGSTHMDVAPGAGALWVAKDDSLYRIDPATNGVEAIPGVVEGPSDVAVGEGSVYVLGTSQLVRLDPVTRTSELLAEIVPSKNQDIAFREGYVWIANGDAGEVTRFDVETRDPSDPIYVGGNFSGIAVDEQAAWVISGGASEIGVLTRISPDSLTVIEPRADLTGRPYDITLGAGAVWVVNQSDGTLTALDPDALPAGDGPEEEREIAFVFGADGDIWAETMDGEVISLVGIQGEERQPTLSPDGSLLAYQRRSAPGGDPSIVVRNLETGEESEVGAGSSPSFGPDGRLAWATLNGVGDVAIAIGRPEEEPVTFDADGQPDNRPSDWPTWGLGVGRISWDLDGSYVYYTVSDYPQGSTTLYQADAQGNSEPFELIPGNHQAGASYLTPSVRAAGSVHVIRTCCDPTSSDLETDLGVIRFTEGGPEYERLASLDALGLAFWLGATLDSAGNLTLEGSGDARNWTHTVVRSWFVVTQPHIWLVDVDGNSILVSEEMGRLGRIDGFETAPQND